MNTKAVIYIMLSIVSLLVALFMFMKSLDWKAIVILLLGMAAVILFRLGVAESKKPKPQ